MYTYQALAEDEGCPAKMMSILHSCICSTASLVAGGLIGHVILTNPNTPTIYKAGLVTLAFLAVPAIADLEIPQSDQTDISAPETYFTLSGENVDVVNVIDI